MSTNEKINHLEADIEFVKILVTDLVKMINLLDSKARCQQRLINLLVNRLDKREVHEGFNLSEISESLRNEGIELNLTE